DLFTFQNLYLYGGLFDIIAVALAHVTSVDPYDLRHILCAMTGISGIAASAATARLIAGPRAGLIAAVALTLCGAWYGAMFNHTKDLPFAARMVGATLFLIPIARSLPSPRRGYSPSNLRVHRLYSRAAAQNFIAGPCSEVGGPSRQSITPFGAVHCGRCPRAVGKIFHARNLNPRPRG